MLEIGVPPGDRRVLGSTPMFERRRVGLGRKIHQTISKHTQFKHHTSTFLMFVFSEEVFNQGLSLLLFILSIISLFKNWFMLHQKCFLNTSQFTISLLRMHKRYAGGSRVILVYHSTNINIFYCAASFLISRF